MAPTPKRWLIPTPSATQPRRSRVDRRKTRHPVSHRAQSQGNRGGAKTVRRRDRQGRRGRLRRHPLGVAQQPTVSVCELSDEGLAGLRSEPRFHSLPLVKKRLVLSSNLFDSVCHVPTNIHPAHFLKWSRRGVSFQIFPPRYLPLLHIHRIVASNCLTRGIV